MKSNEIREWGRYPIDSYTASRTRALVEIAAQLADLNDSSKPRWVWLKTSDGQDVFDANAIVRVRSFMDGEEARVVVNDNWNRTAVIFEPLADVCRKLGIPMPEEQEGKR